MSRATAASCFDDAALARAAARLGTVIRDPSPFSARNAPTPAEQARRARALRDAGVRAFPRPFASAAAVVSDIDASTRETYQAYTEALIERAGMDFGDSYWLYRVYGVSPAGGPFRQTGLGFLDPRNPASPDADLDDDAPEPVLLPGAVGEHLRGNIDHFHAFLGTGPRFAFVFRPRVADGDAIDCSGLRLSEDHQDQARGECFVAALVLVTRTPHFAPAEVDVVCSAGAALAFRRERRLRRAGLYHHLYTVRRDVLAGGARLPGFAEVQRLVLARQSGPLRRRLLARTLDHVILLNTSRSFLLEDLGRVRRRFHVDAPLVVEHGGYGFHAEASLAARLKRMNDTFARVRARGESALFYAAVEQGRFSCSTLADDPRSVANLFPDLVSAHGVRFVNPAGYTGTRDAVYSWFDVISPALTRGGDGVYVVRRTTPAAREPERFSEAELFKSRIETFAARMRTVLEACAREPGGVWPVYTHLGTVEWTAGGGRAMPRPYLEEALCADLADRSFGLRCERPARIWLTRASVLYDYALMINHLAPHVTRRGHRVRIRRWRDPVLGADLPIAPSQLYGVTFDVEDAAAARVTLDGRELRCLARHAGGHREPPSVTVLESDLRIPLVLGLDPRRGLAEPAQGAGWTWSRAERPRDSHGTATVAAGREVRRVRLLEGPVSVAGCQVLVARLRLADAGPEAGVGLALGLRTRTGGTFVFGDPGMAEPSGGATATYQWLRPAPDEDGWLWLVAPLFDLRWERTAAPPLLPNQALASLDLLVRPAGDTAPARVDVGVVEMLRPRCVDPAVRASGCVLCGRAPGARRVWLEPLAAGGEPREALVDATGHWIADGVAEGYYRLGAADAGGARRWHGVDGEIAVAGDRAGLML